MTVMTWIWVPCCCGLKLRSYTPAPKGDDNKYAALLLRLAEDNWTTQREICFIATLSTQISHGLHKDWMEASWIESQWLKFQPSHCIEMSSLYFPGASVYYIRSKSTRTLCIPSFNSFQQSWHLQVIVNYVTFFLILHLMQYNWNNYSKFWICKHM